VLVRERGRERDDAILSDLRSFRLKEFLEKSLRLSSRSSLD
jgi:hypothetical protein